MADYVDAFVAATRAQLLAAGFERRECNGAVWFTRGNASDRAVVLVHGSNDQAGTWAPSVKYLDGLHVVIPDLAGHGESAPHEGPIAMPLMLSRLHAVIEAETSHPVTLAGSSMGGWVAMLYALEHPERVARLVLEDASGIAYQPPVPLFARDREQAQIILRAVHGPDVAMSEDLIEALLARSTSSPMTRVIAGGILGHLLDDRIHQLRLPVHLVWGEHDGVLPLDYARILQSRIEGATLEVIPGAAHIPHRQQPERFAECLRKTF